MAYCRAAAVVGDVDPDVPGYDWRTPTVIVPHTAPDDVPADGVYTFVRSPREAAEVAIGLAGGMDVDLFSASIGGEVGAPQRDQHEKGPVICACKLGYRHIPDIHYRTCSCA